MTYGLGTYGTGTYGIGDVDPGVVTPTPPGEPLVAGVPFQREYTVTAAGVRYERLLLNGGSVTRLRYFTGTNTAAVPVVDVGPFTSTSLDGADWLSPVATILTPGTYTPVVTIQRTSDPANTVTDTEPAVTVYDLDGVIDGEPPAGNLVTLAEVKARLNAKTTTNDDELADLIRAAEAEYEEVIGPIRPTVVVGEELPVSNGTVILPLLPVVSVEAVRTYAGAAPLETDAYRLNTGAGLLHLTSGWGAWTLRSGFVSVDYTAGGLPANHREAIIADVASYYALTQRGASGRSAGSYGDVDDGDLTTPMNLWPRINGLRVSVGMA